MILLDTNILIEVLKGDQKTILKVQALGSELAISSVSVMELYYGARDKQEVKKIEKFVSLFIILYLNESISFKAMKLIQTYAKSHTLDIPDGLIASTVLTHNIELFTYNVKDFKFIEKIQLI